MDESDSATKSKIANLISGVVGDTDQVWTHLISPMKHNYLDESLGPPIQLWGEFTYRRKDDSFLNKRGNQCQFTVYEVDEKEKASNYCVVYLHSHGGCRLEGYPLIKQLSKYGITLVLLDFAGSGHSGGEYISMGHHERFDVHRLLGILKEKYQIKSFALWGRSMGAATILLTYPYVKNEGILALVLDSPFSSVKRVYRNAVKKVINLPDMIIDLIYKYAKNKILEKYHFDLEEIKPLNIARQVIKPTAIIGTKQDKIVDFEDLEQMYLNVSCVKKNLFECAGSHIDDRPDDTLEDTIKFLETTYRKKLELGRMVYVQRSNSQNKFGGSIKNGFGNLNNHSPINQKPQGLTTFHFPQNSETLRGSGIQKMEGIRMVTQKQKKNYLSFRKGKGSKRRDNKRQNYSNRDHSNNKKSNSHIPLGLNLRLNQRNDHKSFADESAYRNKAKAYMERNNSVSVSRNGHHQQAIFTKPPKRNLNVGSGFVNPVSPIKKKNYPSKKSKRKKGERSISLNKMFTAREKQRAQNKSRGISQRSINPPVLRHKTQESPNQTLQKENQYSNPPEEKKNTRSLKRLRRDGVKNDTSKSPQKPNPMPLIPQKQKKNQVLNLNSFLDKRNYQTEKTLQKSKKSKDILKNFNFEEKYENKKHTRPQTSFQQNLSRLEGKRSNSILSSNYDNIKRRKNSAMIQKVEMERTAPQDFNSDYNNHVFNNTVNFSNPNNRTNNQIFQNFPEGANDQRNNFQNRRFYNNQKSHSPSSKKQAYFHNINNKYLHKMNNNNNSRRTPKQSLQRHFVNNSGISNRYAYDKPNFKNESFTGQNNQNFHQESRKHPKRSINSLGNDNSYAYDNSFSFNDDAYTGRQAMQRGGLF